MGDSLNVHLNTKATAQNTYDAIVIGSGISGGWAAKELCEQGLKTLVLERGRNVEHIKDYPTATKAPWEFKHRGEMTKEFMQENPLISKASGFGEATAHFFIKDKDHPYIQEKPIDWIRGYQVGGKSLTWGVPASDGARMNFHHRQNWDMELNGQLVIMKWHHGTRTLKNLLEFAAIRMELKRCLTESICLRLNSIVWKRIFQIPSAKIIRTATWYMHAGLI